MLRTKPNRKTKIRRRPKGRRPKPEDGIFGDDRSHQIIVPRRYRIVSPSMITTLVFQSTAHSPLNNAGLGYASVRFRPTSAYDVDPTIGGTSMPGFNEFSALYGKYRVLRFKSQITFVNQEDFPLNVIVFPSNFDLGANYSQVQSQFGNSFAKYKYLSPKFGMDRATITTPWLSARQIVGTDSVYLDDDYAANTNTSPVNNSYINVAIWTGNATQLVSGVGLQVVISCEVRFSETLHNVTLPDPPELHPELKQSSSDEVDVLAALVQKVLEQTRSKTSKVTNYDDDIQHRQINNINRPSPHFLGVSGSPLCEQTDVNTHESQHACCKKHAMIGDFTIGSASVPKINATKAIDNINKNKSDVSPNN